MRKVCKRGFPGKGLREVREKGTCGREAEGGLNPNRFIRESGGMFPVKTACSSSVSHVSCKSVTGYHRSSIRVRPLGFCCHCLPFGQDCQGHAVKVL